MQPLSSTAPQTGSPATVRRFRSIYRLAGLVVQYEIFVVAAIVVGLIFSVHLPPAVLALLLLLVPAIWLCRWLAERRVVAITPLNFPVLLMLVMVLPALYATADMELSLLGVYRIVAGLAIFYALISYARSWERLEGLVLIALAVGGALAIAGLLDTRFSANKVLPLSRFYRFLPKTSLPIMAAAGANANIVGGTLAMLAPIGLAMLVFPGVPRRLKILAWPSTALMLLTVLLSQSRGAWMGLAASVLVVALLRDRRALVAIPLSLLGVGLVIGRYGMNTIAEALLQSSTIPSAAGRMEIWQRAVYMMQDFPFTGVGLGMYGRVAAILYPFFLISPDTSVPHAHNVFLQAAVDLGIPGLVAFVGLLTVFVVTMLHVWRQGRANSLARPLAVGLLGMMTVFMIHGLVDSITSFIKAYTVLWSLMGLGMAVWLLTEESEGEKTGQPLGAQAASTEARDLQTKHWTPCL